MLKAATHPPTWKVLVKPLRSILDILNETLHQITPEHVVDVMPQPLKNIRTFGDPSQLSEERMRELVHAKALDALGRWASREVDAGRIKFRPTHQ